MKKVVSNGLQMICFNSKKGTFTFGVSFELARKKKRGSEDLNGGFDGKSVDSMASNPPEKCFVRCRYGYVMHICEVE